MLNKCYRCKTKFQGDICPNCNLKLKWYQKNSIFSLIIMLVAIIFFIVCICFAMDIIGDKPKTIPESSNVSNIQTQYIDLEKFNNVETGMSYNEVCNILGYEGELISEVNIGDDKLATKMYAYYGENLGSNANFTFQNDKLISKAQIGLK